MPVIPSAYQEKPLYLFNGHLQTIVPGLFRRVKEVAYRRERITIPDGDFLDLDWSEVNGNALAIISHGLEGSADRPYIKGMVKALNKAGIDALAWNYRTCSGESNKVLRSYHMGATDDLQLVIDRALKLNKYTCLYLIGFSAGGNITLKYLGENPAIIPPQIKKAAVFSVPCDLKSCSETISKPANRIYLNRFLKSLRKKLALKAQDFPTELDLTGYEKLKSFPDFDNRYTAPLHGFKDAENYYASCSSKQFLKNITVPTLIVNALNDPFLSEECYPVAEAEANKNIFLEMPTAGGHVGFTQNFFANEYYSDKRAIQFLTNNTLPSK